MGQFTFTMGPRNNKLAEIAPRFGSDSVELIERNRRNTANDRLVFGIEGSVSEYELALLRQRSAEAIDAKARRGELQFALPAGLCWSDGQIELVAERRIQQAVRMVFDKFDELGSARQVLLWL